jgi:hypothetical protein
MGLTPQLERFELKDDELGLWMRALHGAWVTSGPLDGVAFPGVDADISNAYGAVACLLGWWTSMVALRLRPVDVTNAFRQFLADPNLQARMFHAATWRRWGFTRVALRAAGEPLPVEVLGPDGPRLRIVPVWADHLDATWLDAVGATLLSGHPVKVVGAVRLAPRGRLQGLTQVQVPGGLLRPDDDPVVRLVALRRQARAAEDERLVTLLRVVINAMVYGNPARFDPDGRGGERPGPWCFPPMAATVAAGSRCLLAMLEAEVTVRGGVLAARDTDGALLVASPNGTR